jgi:predicted transposase YbfD/YdcC
MAEKTCDLVELVKAIPDPRRQCRNLKHRLEDILVLGFCATLAGCDDFVEMAEWARHNEAFLRTFLDLPNGVPSHDTLNRVFSLIKAEALQAVLLPWALQRRGPAGDQVHVDGKSLRHARQDRGKGTALHVVSAWASQAGLTLAQVAVDAKSNEITAIPELLRLLDLRDKTVTIDAMGCQREIAGQVVEQEGDYVLSVKDNQPTLHREIQAAFAGTEAFGKGREATTLDDDHGRVESRTVRVLPAAKHLSEATRAAWEGALSLVMVLRVVTCKASGAVSREAAYYLSSLGPDACRIGASIRGHWGIENGLHWVLDVVFREDARRLYDRRAAENVALLNRLAVSVLRGDPAKGSLKVKRKRAGWNVLYLARLLGFPPV